MKDKIIRFLATGAYSGLSGKAPGTCGTVVAVGVYFILSLWVGIWGLVVVSLVLVPVAVGVSDGYLRQKGREKGGAEGDPQEVVIDEWAGYFVAMIGHAASPLALVLAFVLFRFFDITKIWPARRAEQFPGGWGIVLDDVVAGVYANAVLTVSLYLCVSV